MKAVTINTFNEVISVKGKELTVTLFIGDKQIDKLSDEQQERMAERLSETMSRYYNTHSSEYTAMKGR